MIHSVKSVQIRSFFWSVFPCIQSEYSKIRTRKNSVFGHFSRSESIGEIWYPWFKIKGWHLGSSKISLDTIYHYFEWLIYNNKRNWELYPWTFFDLSAPAWKKLSRKINFLKKFAHIKICAKWKTKSYAKKMSRSSRNILCDSLWARYCLHLK